VPAFKTKSGKFASSFQNGTRVAAIVEDSQDDNHFMVEEEKHAIRKMGKVEAPNVGKAHGTAEWVGQKQLIGGFNGGDKSLPKPRR
jgi:hypothetical protein